MKRRNCDCHYGQPRTAIGAPPLGSGGSGTLSPAPALPTLGCTRIATNQTDAHQDLYEPPLAFAGVEWRGQTSGARGRHVRFMYERLLAGTHQQYIIMQNVTGHFVDDENLLQFNADPPNQQFAILLPPGITFKTRATAAGGAAQTMVDCDTGNSTASPIESLNPFPALEESLDLNLTYQFTMDAYYGATVIGTPNMVTGVTSGATGMFSEWAVTEIGEPVMRLNNYTLGPGDVPFLPGEEFVFSKLDSPPTFLMGNPTREAVYTPT